MNLPSVTPTKTNHGRALPIALALVLLLGLVARVGVAIHQGLSDGPARGSDQQEYDTYAWNLAQGNGYRGMSPDVADQDHLTAYRPPGPSLLMAGTYLLAGHSYAAVRLVHCLLGALSIWLVFRIGRKVYSDSVGFLAAAAYAVFPLSVLQSTELVSEPLGVFLLLLFIDAALGFATRPTWMRAVWAGVVLGVGLLTRANYVLLLPLLAVWAIAQFRGNWRALLRAVAAPSTAALVLLPWAVRNYQVFHEFIPFSTMGGSVLLQGNNDVVMKDHQYYGYSVWDTKIPECRAALQSAGDEVERDKRARQFAIDWLKNNPAKWPVLLGNKFIRSWTPFLTENPYAAQRALYLLSWGPVLLLFLPAFVVTFYLGFRKRHPALLLDLAILYYVANSLIFFANIRYRAPVDPLCIILASLSVVWLLAYGRRARSGDIASAEETANGRQAALALPSSMPERVEQESERADEHRSPEIPV